MTLKLAQLQLPVHPDKAQNLDALAAAMTELDAEAPDLVTVGEMFVCPYETAAFPLYAEAEGGETWQFLSRLAAEHHVYLSAGTIPERDETGRIFNTAYVFDRNGRMIAKHRKMHLFDVDIRDGQRFRESETLAAGDEVTVFDTEFGKIGLCVCFDIRFPELARLMADAGARLVLVPAAFNTTTGPAHWELTFRARALDNQCFYAGTSPAQNRQASYHAWGHSLVVSPWGEVLGELDEKAGHLLTELELDCVEDIRAQLPLLSARRSDLYELRPKPTIVFRRAVAADLAAVTAVYDALHTEEEAGRAVIGWKRDIYPTVETAQLALSRGDLFVAETNGVIVGSARINQEQVPEYRDGAWRYPAPDEQILVLHTLTISPSAAGCGLGTRFVRFYEQLARARNCRFLRIDTNERNLRARALYRKLGFTEAGVVPCTFNGLPDVRLVLLEKKL